MTSWLGSLNRGGSAAIRNHATVAGRAPCLSRLGIQPTEISSTRVAVTSATVSRATPREPRPRYRRGSWPPRCRSAVEKLVKEHRIDPRVEPRSRSLTPTTCAGYSAVARARVSRRPVVAGGGLAGCSAWAGTVSRSMTTKSAILGSPQCVDGDEPDVLLAMAGGRRPCRRRGARGRSVPRGPGRAQPRTRPQGRHRGNLRPASVSRPSRATDRLHASGSTARKAYR